MLQFAGLADHRIHHARESTEKLSAGGWKELVDAVQRDRLSFHAFLRDPANEPIIRELLYLESNDFYDADLEHCLERNSALLEGFLGSGTKLQKLAVMDKYRGSEWHGDVAAPLRRRLTELYTSLLSDPDPEIRGDALRSLLAHDWKALELRMAEVRGAWPVSADVGVQLQVLTDLAFLPIPEAPSVHSFLVEKVRGLLESDDAKIRLQAVGVLDIVATHGESDALGDCASVLACAFKGTRDPEVFRGFLETSVRLPMAHLGRILGEARASAPTPELQRATENVLHAIKGGETRSKAFLRILDDALGASTRMEIVGSER